MAKSFTLLNVDEGIYADNLRIDESNTDSAGTWNVQMQRLRGGLSEGVDVVRLDNGCTTLYVLPTRGMGIWKAQVAGVRVGWNSPVERPVHPMFVDEMRRGGIGWLDGFNELVCRCGLAWHGAPGNDVVKDEAGNVVSEQFLPLHGRIANLSAHEVRVEIADDGAISLVGVVDEASMFGGKLRLTSTLTTYPDSNSFEINDVVENLAASTAEVEMLYHCNFGEPLLGAGATVKTASREVAPRNDRAAQDIDSWQTYSAPTEGYEEQVYFTKPIADESGRSLAVLRSAAEDRAVALRFDVKTLPWLIVWKNTQAQADGYCTGLEPGSSFPNLRTFERQQGRVISLESRQSVAFDLAFSFAQSSDDVAALVAECDSLQGPHETKVHRTPNPDWSAPE